MEANTKSDNADDTTDQNVSLQLSDTKTPRNDDDSRLEQYEEMFKTRYTDEDSSFVESVAKPLRSPPIVHPWYTKSNRNFDHNRSHEGRDGFRGQNMHFAHRGWRENRSSRRYSPYN